MLFSVPEFLGKSASYSHSVHDPSPGSEGFQAMLKVAVRLCTVPQITVTVTYLKYVTIQSTEPLFKTFCVILHSFLSYSFT